MGDDACGDGVTEDCTCGGDALGERDGVGVMVRVCGMDFSVGRGACSAAAVDGWLGGREDGCGLLDGVDVVVIVLRLAVGGGLNGLGLDGRLSVGEL